MASSVRSLCRALHLRLTFLRAVDAEFEPLGEGAGVDSCADRGAPQGRLAFPGFTSASAEPSSGIALKKSSVPSVRLTMLIRPVETEGRERLLRRPERLSPISRCGPCLVTIQGRGGLAISASNALAEPEGGSQGSSAAVHASPDGSPVRDAQAIRQHDSSPPRATKRWRRSCSDWKRICHSFYF